METGCAPGNPDLKEEHFITIWLLSIQSNTCLKPTSHESHIYYNVLPIIRLMSIEIILDFTRMLTKGYHFLDILEHKLSRF